jgi:threonine/homoserine/homoserine lactone efflux protein
LRFRGTAVIHLAQGAALGFSAAVSPGPFQAFVLAQSLRHGALRTLPVALAPLASDGPIIALVLLALTRAPLPMLRGLQIAGGILLLYLAWSSFRSLRAPGAVAASPPETHTPAKAFARAVMVNALGPGPWVFWSVISGPILLQAWRQSPLRGLSFLAGFYLVLCGSNAALVLLFAGARRLGPRATAALGALSGAILLGFGLHQLWSGLVGA